MKILILAANPKKDLDLDVEIRDLQGVIARSRKQEQLDVVPCLAVRPREDLQDLLFTHDPDILHFCGHGRGEQGLVFHEGQMLPGNVLADLLELYADKVKCVLLNACYSEVQAEAIVQHIDYVIGIRQGIKDKAAIAFTTGFYRALSYGRPIEQCFKFGCNQIQLAMLETEESISRSAIPEEQRKLEVIEVVENTISLPEELKPVLKRKTSLTVDSHIPLVKERISTQTQISIQLDIDRAYAKEHLLKQYREKVREYLEEDHLLSDREMLFLNQFRKDLGLLADETEKIIQEEQEPFENNRKDYKGCLIELIEMGRYPFDDKTKKQLKELQERKNLNQEEEVKISTPILEAAEAKHRLPYRKLQTLLEARQWKQADQETTEQLYELMRYGERDWLKITKEDIQTLPYTEIQAIDRLWTEYSGGKFGFSIQKQIWQECGSIMGHISRWRRFCEQVGWRKNGTQIKVSEINFSISAPRGHLPVCINLNQCGIWIVGVSPFAVRLENREI